MCKCQVHKYKVREVHINYKHTEELLNQKGKHGWELVQVILVNNFIRYYFHLPPCTSSGVPVSL